MRSVLAPVLFGLLLATVLPSRPLEGQVSDERHAGHLHGVVRERDTGVPIPGARVSVIELSRGDLSGADGGFELLTLPPGRFTLVAERIGYATHRSTVEIFADRETEVVLDLVPSPIQIPGLLISAGILGARPLESSRPVQAISGTTLDRRLDGTLAGTLAGIPGVAVAATGPATGRPVLRGLSGERVLLLEDGKRMGDLSGSSGDHAVTSDPLEATRVEVVRGPSAFLHGSSALGGVVNVVREEIPSFRPAQTRGSASLNWIGVQRSFGAGGDVVVPAPHGWALKVQGSGRADGLLRTPEGLMPNTDGHRWSGSLGAGVHGDDWNAGGSVRALSQRYGIPGGFVGSHPGGIEIRMRRQSARVEGALVRSGSMLRRVEASGLFTRYAHEEIEAGGAIGTAFGVLAARGEVTAFHGGVGAGHFGALGLRFDWEDHAFGGELSTPDAGRIGVGLVAVEELRGARWSAEGGVRFDLTHLDVRRGEGPSGIGVIRDRAFRSVSGGVGLGLEIVEGTRAGLSISRGFRTPEIQELYSSGPHLAAYSFDVGDPDLPIEVATGVDLFLRWERPSARGELAVYSNRIEDFIYPRATGRTSRIDLPIFQQSSGDAWLSGWEGSMEWSPVRGWAIEGSASSVRGTLRTEETPLPFIPPLSAEAGLRWEDTRRWVALRARGAGPQNRTARFETATAGWTVLDLAGGVQWTNGGRLSTLVLRLNNLLDRSYRNHLSRTRAILPEAGFGATLLLRHHF